MATANDQQQAGRPLIANVRVSAAERDHLHRVAAQRGTNLSGLIRQALAADGALPRPAA